jgi:translation initiation factor 2B subunit (eIF-2B alpha/beta/delta family)
MKRVVDLANGVANHVLSTVVNLATSPFQPERQMLVQTVELLQETSRIRAHTITELHRDIQERNDLISAQTGNIETCEEMIAVLKDIVKANQEEIALARTYSDLLKERVALLEAKLATTSKASA